MYHIIFMFIIVFQKITYIEGTPFLNKENKPLVKISYFKKCTVDKNTYHTVDVSIGMVYKNVPAVNFTWTALQQFDDTYNIVLTMLKWADGGWKNHFNMKEKNGCSMFLKVFGNIWREFAKSSNVSSTCPVPKGYYQILNQQVSPSVGLGPLLIWPGRFILRLQFIHNDKIQVCYETEITIIEILAYGGKGIFDKE